VADPGGLIRPWPPSVLAIEFGRRKEMIAKVETGVETKEKR